MDRLRWRNKVQSHGEDRSGGSNSHQRWLHGAIGRDSDHASIGDVKTSGQPSVSCHVPHTSVVSGTGGQSSLINATGSVNIPSIDNHGRHVNHARRKAILRGNGRAGFLVVANDREEQPKLAIDPISFSETPLAGRTSLPLFNGNQMPEKWANPEGLDNGHLGTAKAGAALRSADEKQHQQHQFQQQETSWVQSGQNGHFSLPNPKQQTPAGWPSRDFPPNESSSSQPHEHTAQDMLSCTASIDSGQFGMQGKPLLHFLEDGSAAYTVGFGSDLSVHQTSQAAAAQYDARQLDAPLGLERVSSAPVPLIPEGFHENAFEDFDDGFGAGLWSGHAQQQGSLLDHMQVDGNHTPAGHQSAMFGSAASPPESTFMALMTGEKGNHEGADEAKAGVQIVAYDDKDAIAADGCGGDDGDGSRKIELEQEEKPGPDMALILEAAQELLMEVCRCPTPSRKWKRRHDSSYGDGAGQRPSLASSSISGMVGQGQVQTIPVGGTREQAQRLRALLAEVEKSYGKYKEQNKALATAFDVATGTEGSANMYTRPSLHAISTAFRSVKDGIEANLQRLAR